MIVLDLFDRLPERYVALPRVHLGSAIEVDVGAFENDLDRPIVRSDRPDEAGVATAVWSPSSPTLAVATDFPDVDEYEVRVYDTKRTRRLVAAIEILSPANLDRPEHRRAFVAKCASMLKERASVVIVDLVTTRSANLYAELMDFIGEPDLLMVDDPPPLYAVACRYTGQPGTRMLETWVHPLTLGEPLPTLPLWLSEDLAIPLDLERTYAQTCRVLRIG